MTETGRTRRLVLRRFPSKDPVVAFANSKSWQKVSETPHDWELGIHEEVMWLVSDGIYFYYTEEYVSENACIGLIETSISGTSELFAEISDTSEPFVELEEEFNPWQLSELLASIDDSATPSELAGSVVRAALGAPVQFDWQFFVRIRDAATHSEFMVRDIAVSATAYPAWPQFRPLLREIADSDPVVRVRDNASFVLESFDRVGVPKP